MNIIERVERLQALVAERGDYKTVAAESGVTFHWLQKFAIGKIPNPGVVNVAKLEAYFSLDCEDAVYRLGYMQQRGAA
ncbi:hypothetical protein ACQE3E_06535 [Methylomonas sp. MED-D]|uniref:hypothetical protein n=1 Tax=Methylomonas sp. MED-D TaxID=3418768 RepID=UPI003D057DA9